MFIYFYILRVSHLQGLSSKDGGRVGEIRFAHVEELDTAAKASRPDGGGDSGASPASVAACADQKPRVS